MAKKKTEKKSTKVYELKIWLKNIKPPIWRRFVVPSDMRLSMLHNVIQDVMGWMDSHLHSFMVGDKHYSQPDPDFDSYGDVQDESKAKLTDLVRKRKDRFMYEYDYGDGWEHVVEVVSVGPAEPGVKYPVCLAGKRACPPEDCGGPWGYGGLLEAMRNPDHPEHEEMLDWVGDQFDPEAFDLKRINWRIQMYH